ncbi:hypothetical protein Taro_048566, partial [Colocasia esculenta]|nr:hypothetical protein [Colocasia esculenta]
MLPWSVFYKVVGRLIAEGESVAAKYMGRTFCALQLKPMVSSNASLQVAKEGYNIKMGRRKRFTVVDSKEDREGSPKKKTGPSCDTDAKKAKKKIMKEVYDGEPKMLDTLIFQEHVFVGCDSINAFK